MRTAPPGWETDEDSIGLDTDDTQSIDSEWEVSSSLSPSSEDVDMPDSSAEESMVESGAESDCTAIPDEIPDEAFDFDTIEADPFPSVVRQVDFGENASIADERLMDRSLWPELWEQVSLDCTGPFGFVSDSTTTPASVSAYGAEDYVRDVDVQPHPFAHCRGARTENRLGTLPNVETLRLFVEYTDIGPTMHGSGPGQLCPALCAFAPSAVVLRGMSLVFDDIALEIWIPRVLDRMNRLVLVLDPGPTGEQWRKHATSTQPTEMANAGIASVLRALPHLDLTIVFNTEPGEIWDSGCNPVVINALGHLLANFGGTATIVNLESVTSYPILHPEQQVENLAYLGRMKYNLNKTIFERGPAGRPPRYLSMCSWMRRCLLANKAVEAGQEQWDTKDAWARLPLYNRRFFKAERRRLGLEAAHQPHPPMMPVPRPTEQREGEWPDFDAQTLQAMDDQTRRLVEDLRRERAVPIGGPPPG